MDTTKKNSMCVVQCILYTVNNNIFGGGDNLDCGYGQGCIFRLTCSYPELNKDHVLTSAYVKIFRTVTRNVVNKSVWRKKDCFWLPLNKHAMNIWLSSLKIRAHLLLENRKTSPCSPCAPNLPHVLVSRIPGYHNLCSPAQKNNF